MDFPPKTTAYGTPSLRIASSAPISIIRSDNPQDDQCACCRWNGEVSQLIPSASRLLELKLVIAPLPWTRL